jgi:hypothetical protein
MHWPMLEPWMFLAAASILSAIYFAMGHEILEPFVEPVAFREQFPVLGHLQKISLGFWVGSGICPHSTPSGGFQTFSLLFRQSLKHGTPPTVQLGA